ncbi:hypothetical protein WR25_10528 [Diploscapter pachys]|uniref:Uncharacterized protein n=1 Tax=Diploscapter pachys TaxID=2018661 RepID=A0A2A2JYU1_9BILA|nr:hypothetical protein WR25_10528 [Diploscapter pachys]
MPAAIGAVAEEPENAEQVPDKEVVFMPRSPPATVAKIAEHGSEKWAGLPSSETEPKGVVQKFTFSQSLQCSNSGSRSYTYTTLG